MRRTRGGSWVCLSCRTGDGTCDHVGSAVAASKADGDGSGESSDSDIEEDASDEARLLELAGLAAAASEEAVGAAEVPPHLPRASMAHKPMNQFKWSTRSDGARHLVPPHVAQQEPADMMRALKDPQRKKIVYSVNLQCPFCRVGRTDTTRIGSKNCKVEFDDGVVVATVETWRCHQSLFRVLPDGKARGVMFHSGYTAY